MLIKLKKRIRHDAVKDKQTNTEQGRQIYKTAIE